MVCCCNIFAPRYPKFPQGAAAEYVKPEDDDGLPYIEHRVQIKQLWKRNRILQLHFALKKLLLMQEEGVVQLEIPGSEILRIDPMAGDPTGIVLTYRTDLARPVLNIYADTPEQRVIVLRDLSEFMRQLRLR